MTVEKEVSRLVVRERISFVSLLPAFMRLFSMLTDRQKGKGEGERGGGGGRGWVEVAGVHAGGLELQ